MLTRIKGTTETLKKLEEAQQLIEQAKSILWKLPHDIHIEVLQDSSEDETTKERQ